MRPETTAYPSLVQPTLRTEGRQFGEHMGARPARLRRESDDRKKQLTGLFEDCLVLSVAPIVALSEIPFHAFSSANGASISPEELLLDGLDRYLHSTQVPFTLHHETSMGTMDFTISSAFLECDLPTLSDPGPHPAIRMLLKTGVPEIWDIAQRYLRNRVIRNGELFHQDTVTLEDIDSPPC